MVTVLSLWWERPGCTPWVEYLLILRSNGRSINGGKESSLQQKNVPSVLTKRRIFIAHIL